MKPLIQTLYTVYIFHPSNSRDYLLLGDSGYLLFKMTEAERNQKHSQGLKSFNDLCGHWQQQGTSAMGVVWGLDEAVDKIPRGSEIQASLVLPGLRHLNQLKSW